MPRSPEPDAGRRAAITLALACGLTAADAPAPKAYLLLAAPDQLRESVQGVVRGRTSARYLVMAAPGEALDVRLTANNPAVYYTLSTPGGAVLLYDSSDPDAAKRFMRKVAPGGRYRLEVRLADAAARRNTTATYSLSVARQAQLIPAR